MSLFAFLSDTKKKQIEGFMTKVLNHITLTESARGDERSERRCHIALGVRVTPCAQGHEPDVGKGFDAVIKDLSISGLSFSHRRQFGGNERVIVSVEFDGAMHHLLCEVRHCTPVGRGLFLTGCVLLERLQDVPALAHI